MNIVEGNNVKDQQEVADIDKAAQIQKVVFDFVSKTVQTKLAEGNNYYGDYFDSAAYGSHYPRRVVSITKHPVEGNLQVCYTCGSVMYHYVFTMAELT